MIVLGSGGFSAALSWGIVKYHVQVGHSHISSHRYEVLLKVLEQLVCSNRDISSKVDYDLVWIYRSQHTPRNCMQYTALLRCLQRSSRSF